MGQRGRFFKSSSYGPKMCTFQAQIRGTQSLYEQEVLKKLPLCPSGPIPPAQTWFSARSELPLRGRFFTPPRRGGFGSRRASNYALILTLAH